MKRHILSAIAVLALAPATASAQDALQSSAEAFGVCLSNFIASGDSGNFDEGTVLNRFRQMGYTQPSADPLVVTQPGIGHAGLLKYGEFYDYNFNQTIGEFGCVVHAPTSDASMLAERVRPVVARYGDILTDSVGPAYSMLFLQPPETGAFVIHISTDQSHDYPGHTAVYIAYGGQ